MIYDKKSYSFIVKSIINNNCIIERFYRLLSSLSELYDCQSAGGGQHEYDRVRRPQRGSDCYTYSVNQPYTGVFWRMVPSGMSGSGLMISSSKKEMKQGDAFSHEIYLRVKFM